MMPPLSVYPRNSTAPSPRDRRPWLRIDRMTAGNYATLEFQTVSKRTYTVQYKDDLNGISWSKLADVVARPTNHTEVITDPASTTQRYYRLVTPRQP